MPVKLDMKKIAMVTVPVVPCTAYGVGGECYFTLCSTPGCGSKPCDIQRDGLKLYTRKHPEHGATHSPETSTEHDQRSTT